MARRDKTLAELLDFGRGLDHPTTLEAELLTRIEGILVARAITESYLRRGKTIYLCEVKVKMGDLDFKYLEDIY